MYLNAKNVVGFASLAAAAVLSWFWGRPSPVDQRPGGQPDAPPLGFYLRDAAVLGTDEDGRVLYRVWAEWAEERPDDDKLLLSEVRVEYQPAAGVPWRLRAGNGEAPTSHSYLDLSGGVELARQPEDGGNGTLIQTERLRFEPGTFLASTAEDVSVFFDGRRLDAVGMTANLKEDRLELESNVHGQFDP